jgi:hypothetical protein
VIDRAGIRIAGWSLLIGGGIAGGVVSAIGFAFQDNWKEEGRFTMGFTGAAFAIVSITVGVILAVQGDEGQLERLSRRDTALVRW